MRILYAAIVGGIIGFLTVYLTKNKIDVASFAQLEVPVAIIIIGVNIVLVSVALYWRKKLLGLTTLKVVGEEEDLLDDQKYAWSNKYSIFTQTAVITGLLGISYVSILDMELAYIVATLILTCINCYFSLTLPSLFNKLYPERCYPSPNDKDYTDKVLAMADEGERQIILVALYKTYNLVVQLCCLGIVGSIIYSIMTGTSQLFSIFVLSAILIVSQVKYSLSIKREG